MSSTTKIFFAKKKDDRGVVDRPIIWMYKKGSKMGEKRPLSKYIDYTIAVNICPTNIGTFDPFVNLTIYSQRKMLLQFSNQVLHHHR